MAKATTKKRTTSPADTAGLDRLTSPKRGRSSGRFGIGYIRVSRTNGRDKLNDGDSYHTEAWQRDKIEALAAAAGVTVVGWEIDTDQSGKKWERPGFQAALAAVDRGDATVVLVARFSRFARSVIDAHRALERIEGPNPSKPKGQLIAGDLNVDTTTPQGRMMRGIMALIAQFELEVHTENWSEYRGRAIQNGVYARRPPVGYKRDQKRRLVPDKKTAKLVKELFLRRAEGESWGSLVNWWHKAGGPRMTRQRLSYTIQNRVYLGEYNDTVEIAIPNAHTPLVDRDTFEAAQGARALRPARTAHGSLLSGLLVCSGCGKRMTATSARGRRYYRCQQTDASGTCTGKQSVLMELADQVVEEAALERANELKAGPVEGDPATDEELIEAVELRDQAEAELRAFVQAVSVSRYGDLYLPALQEREQALTDAAARVTELRQQGRVENALVQATDVWDDLTVAEQRILIGQLVNAITVHPSLRNLGQSPVDVKLAAIRDRLEIDWFD